MAAVHNFELDQGSHWSRHILWQDASGNPNDLTDYEARMQIRRYHGGAVVLELTSEADSEAYRSITLGGTDGTIDLEVLADVSSALQLTGGRPFVYDLELIPNGDETLAKRLLEGAFRISPEVTRDDPVT